MGSRREPRKFKIHKLLIVLFSLALLLSPFSSAVFADDSGDTGNQGEPEQTNPEDGNNENGSDTDGTGGNQGEGPVCGQDDYFYVIVDDGQSPVESYKKPTMNILNDECELLGSLEIHEIFGINPVGDLWEVRSVDENSFPDHLEAVGPVLDFKWYDWVEEDPINDRITGEFTLRLKVEEGISNPKMYHQADGSSTWEEVESKVDNGFVVADVENFSKYGVFQHKEFIDFDVTKVWEGEEHESVSGCLLIDGDCVEEFVLEKDTDWKHTFYERTFVGDDRDITIVEDDTYSKDYHTSITGNTEDGFVITNSEYVDITVTKEWEGQPQESVSAYLTINGDVNRDELAVLNEGNDWTYTFEHIQTFAGDDREFSIVELEEDFSDDYHTTISGNAMDGFVITNTEIIPEPETIDITVTKEWVGKAQDSAIVYLVINGQRYEEGKVVLSEENDWTHTFEGFYPVIDGMEFEFTIEEEPIDGYEVEVTGNVEDGFIVTNTEIIQEPAPKSEPKSDPKQEEPTEDSGKTLPKTATNNFTIGLIGFLMTALGGGVYFINRRMTRKEN